MYIAYFAKSIANPTSLLYIYAHGARQEVKLAISVVDKDGEAVAGSTIVVKQTNSSGTTISAGSDGKYTIPANIDTVYISVAKTNYTTNATTYDVSGVENISATKSVVVTLEASE